MFLNYLSVCIDVFKYVDVDVGCLVDKIQISIGIFYFQDNYFQYEFLLMFNDGWQSNCFKFLFLGGVYIFREVFGKMFFILVFKVIVIRVI